MITSTFLEMALDSQRCRAMETPDGYGKRTGDCGDTVEIFLSVRNNRIEAVTYLTDGCINTNACANTVAHMAEGKSLDEAWKITPDKVIFFLRVLPLQKTHCAELAVGALYLALTDYSTTEKSTWKRLYRHKN